MTLAFLLCLFALTPSQFDAVSRQAAIAREANRTEEAIKLYRDSVRLKPSWPEGWWQLGSLLYERDEYAGARDAFGRVARLEPKSGPAWAMLGLCEYRTREHVKAAEHLQQALKLGLGDNARLIHAARYHLALLLTRFGEFEAALQTFVKLANDGIDDPGAVAAAGIAALRLPLLPPELPEDTRPMAFQVGRAVYDTGARRAADASREWREIVAQYGTLPNIHYLFGGFLLLSDSDAAILEWKRELEISPDHVPARLQLAYEYLKRGDTESALPYAEQAVKLEPGSFVAHNALGRTLVEAGDLTRGIAELEAASKGAPQSPENRVALASAYAKAGRKEDAARERAEFLRLKKEQER
jgi:tetratricopeptide (TPR) repeat protein